MSASVFLRVGLWPTPRHNAGKSSLGQVTLARALIRMCKNYTLFLGGHKERKIQKLCFCIEERHLFSKAYFYISILKVPVKNQNLLRGLARVSAPTIKS